MCTAGAVLSTKEPTLQLNSLHEIASLCEEGKLEAALLLLQNGSLEELGSLQARVDAIGTLLQACGQRKEVEIGRRVHEFVSGELCGNAVLNTRLITMYSMCGSPGDALNVFDGLLERNLYQWNAAISNCTRNEMWEKAMNLFLELISMTELVPDNFTLPCVIKACGGLLSMELGEVVHGYALRMGLTSDVFVGNALVAMYGKGGSLDESVKVFEKMCERNLVSWNALICALSENGLLEGCFDVYEEMMQVDGLRPDVATLVTLLPLCAEKGQIDLGRLLHGLAVRLGLTQELQLNNALIDMYAKCGSLLDAQLLFVNADQKNVVTWNAIIGGYSSNGYVKKTFDLLHQMQIEGMWANTITILNALSSCLDESGLTSLKELHCHAIRKEFELDEMVANALIAAYAKCGLLRYADHVFKEMNLKTVNSWNALIGGYAQNGDPSIALDLFCMMRSLRLQPDWFTIGSLLLACSHLKLTHIGKAIHGFAFRNGLDLDSFISISLISLYIQCGKASSARRLFDNLEDKSVVTWNAMITGYSQNNLGDEALLLFRQMMQEGLRASEISILAVVSACSQLSALGLGKEVHCFALKEDLVRDPFVGSAVVDMYAKCGCIEQAEQTFEDLAEKDLVSWTVMIAGYGINGQGKAAVKLFEQMQNEGLKPDSFTYTGILMACSHGGLVEEGLKYFEQMQSVHDLEPKLDHYTCVVDMLGRAGRLKDAVKIIDDMSEEPDSGIYAAFLGACKVHGNIYLGERIAYKLLELEPNKAENHVLVSNFFAAINCWDAVRMVRKKMKEVGLRKEAGKSWIEYRGRLYQFMVNDKTCYESEQIWQKWRLVEEKILGIGYVPDTNLVLHDLNEQEKLEILRGHSEKLAISFGLLKTGKDVRLRICKNLRMCGDCHTAIKLVSKVEEREIVVRDNKRFHHFRDGMCSCGDYW